MDISKTERFIFLSDRWGDIHATAEMTPEQIAAVNRLAPTMYDEVTFVVQDKMTGTVGILVDYEYCTVGDAEPSELQQAWGRDITLDEQLEYVATLADELQAKFPQGVVDPIYGEQSYRHRIELRVYLREGIASEPLAEDIYKAIELGPQPTAPAP